MQRVNFIRNPGQEHIGANAEEFLRLLGGPACLLLEGEDSSRCRGLVTLLHGNEPSGVIALHRWLSSGQQPAVNIVCVVAAVESALLTPVFEHRHPPGQRDLNRCFRPPFADQPGRLAEEILEILRMHEPECVVDMHNTSGAGPAFGVASFMDRHHESMVALFAERLVLTHIRLGALMEISDHRIPTVTVEVGGRADNNAHQIAYDGLQQYFLAHDVLNKQADPQHMPLDVYTNPVRLELASGLSLDYGSAPSSQSDLTLRDDIERFNFGITPENTLLGWSNNDQAINFTALDALGRCAATELVHFTGNELRTRQALRCFMITQSADIALSDCLFYAVSADGSEFLA